MPGVLDKDVNRALVGFDVLDRLAYLLLVAYVGDQCDHWPPVGPQCGGDLLDPRRVGVDGHDGPRADFREATAERRTDPPTGSRDYRNPVLATHSQIVLRVGACVIGDSPATETACTVALGPVGAKYGVVMIRSRTVVYSL